MKFLKPLSDATEKLCATAYPTINTIIPIYVVVIEKLKAVCFFFLLFFPSHLPDTLILTVHITKHQVQHTYDVSQLIPAADDMIEKLEVYLIAALKKPGPVCATILDPRIKLEFYKAHFDSLVIYGHSADSLKHDFIEAAQAYATLAAPDVLTSQPSSLTPYSSLDDDLFGAPDLSHDGSVGNEITRYLLESLEHKDNDILVYWKGRAKVYPALAAMAMAYLATPGTSCPSEHVFSEGRAVLRYARSALKPDTVERLLCVKEWSRAFGPAYFDTLND